MAGYEHMPAKIRDQTLPSAKIINVYDEWAEGYENTSTGKYSINVCRGIFVGLHL